MAIDKVKNSIVMKARLIYGFVFVLLIVVLVRVILLKTSDQEELKKAAAAVEEFVVEGMRGDILSSDGRILATSMPAYELMWDFRAPRLSKGSFFENNVDSLAKCMSKLFGDSTAEYYSKTFREAYKAQKGYFPVKRRVTRTQLAQIRKFPIFELGRFKSGLIVNSIYTRVTPHGNLAGRTIGSCNKNGAQVGIEKSHDNQLAGVNGKLLMTKRGVGDYYPIESYDGNIEPKDGCDVITTIDVEIQDIAEKSLMDLVIKNKAKFGTAIVMEVATGKIRAMANYGDYKNTGKYSEDYNYAVKMRLPPGSTYKLASMIAVLDKTNMDIDDMVDLKDGQYRVPGRDKPITDDHDMQGKHTIREIFERSSNVGVMTLVRNTYPTLDDEVVFTSRLSQMNLDKLSGVDLDGEEPPLFRYAGDKDFWSRSSLEMMSIGYETEYVPLQILTLYNAVANDGRMVRPSLLEAVKFHGKIIETYKPDVICSSICSYETIKKVREMLRGVVLKGTAQNINLDYCPIAGKTGTAQLYNKGKVEGHSASFAGFFPADHPKYSCIVVIGRPDGNDVYGRTLAAPVFKKIVENLYARDRDLHTGKDFDIASMKDLKQLPDSKDGDRAILDRLFSVFNMPVGNVENSQNLFVSTTNENGVVMLEPISTRRVTVPNVVGMGLRDAMFILRKKNLKVNVVGRGVVKKQSLPVNAEIKGGEKITIELAVN